MSINFSISGAATTATFSENNAQAAAQLLFGDVTFNTILTGGDTLNLNGGTLTLGGAAEDDLLSIRNQGDGAGEIGFDGGFISFGGTQIGTVTGGYDGNALGIDFNANATAAAVEALVENLTFKSASDTPTETRSLTLGLTDGDGNSLSPTPGTMSSYERADYANDPLSRVSIGDYGTAYLDINNDGRLDTARLDSYGDGISVFLANPAGGNPLLVSDVLKFPSPTDPHVFHYADPNDISVVDLDGDGDQDVVVTDYYSELYSFRNNGDGSFTFLDGADNPLAGIDVGSFTYSVFADVDNDGDFDLVSATYGAGIRTWLQASDGSFTEAAGTDNPFNGLGIDLSRKPVFADIDFDGDQDMILHRFGEATDIHLNDGNGGFTLFTGAHPFQNIANDGDFGPQFNFQYSTINYAADVDGDGDIDLASLGSSDRHTLLNITPANPTIAITVTAEDDPTESYGIPEEMDANEDTITVIDLTEFSITDPDADGAKTITLTASEGTLFAEDAASVTITGQGTGQLRLTGLIEDLSFFMSGEGAVSYRGSQDAFGEDAATIDVAVIDGETPVSLGEVSVHIADVLDELDGTPDKDALTGDNGMNLMHGRAANDRLNGMGGQDELRGDAGNDRLDGGTDADVMIGGTGNDAYFVDNVQDVVTETTAFSAGGGMDTVHTTVNFALGAHTEVLRMGGSDELIGEGNDGANILVGNDAANLIFGHGGNDRLVGNGGQDVLIGNSGADTLTGGAGVDIFVFTSIADSRAGAGHRDTINGFLNLREEIDLSAIDANTYNGSDTNDSWTFIGNRAFDGTWGDSAGQLRTQNLGEGINAVLVEGDHNGDGVADFQILINGTTWMTGSDFVL